MIKRYIIGGLDPGGASGVACEFDSDTGSTSGPSFSQATVNFHGAAGATVNFQITTYTNTNNLGRFLIDGTEYFLNGTLNVVLDGSGNGSFVYRIEGNASDVGTIVRAIITITGVNIGQLGSPLNHQESKVF